MEPKETPIIDAADVVARQAATKAEAAGLDLVELHETIAFFFKVPTDDPIKSVRLKRQRRRRIVTDVWELLARSRSLFEVTPPTSVQDQRLARTFAEAVDAVERLGNLVEDQYEAEAGPLMLTRFDFLGLRTKEELVMLLTERCGLSPKEIAHPFVRGTEGEAWAPCYRPRRFPDEHGRHDHSGNVGDIEEKLKLAAGEVRTLKFRQKELKATVEAKRRAAVERDRHIDWDNSVDPPPDPIPPWRQPAKATAKGTSRARTMTTPATPRGSPKARTISGVTTRGKKKRST